jgi:cytosine/adenosine deaminase-related metal-dependent hydrolase
VAVEGDRILGVTGDPPRGSPALSWFGPSTAIRDLGERAILPGLVNAHTHLELSWMRGRVPRSSSMPAWAAGLMALRASVGSDPAPPIHEAIHEARAAGTSLVGDITNTLAAYEPLARSELGGAVFRELLGFNAPDPEGRVTAARAQIESLPASPRLRASVAPHAPFSVSPALFRAIASASGGAPISVHLGESPEEIQFLRDGTGAWRELLGRIGAWDDHWQPPGCGPVEYLDALGLVGSHLLAVHGTHLTDPELRRLAGAGSTIVSCPRSNRWVGAGSPPIDRFYASGVRVAIGTDSLASVGDLNLFAELAEIRRLAPAVPAARLLESATWCGAAALGFGADYGTLEQGKRADLIAVRIPANVEDVEEYLVASGVEPDAIEWLS